MIRRTLGWAARLYPRAWRERYGEEFLATVEDMPAPGWAAVWDAGKGAIAMQLHHHGRVFLRRAAILGAAGFVLAGLISLQIPDEYYSRALVGAANVESKVLLRSVENVLSRQRLVELVDKHELYAELRTRLPLEDILETMRKSIKVSAPKGAARAFEIGFLYEDGPLAQRVANDLVSALLQENRASTGAGLFTVLDAAPNPAPIYPNRPVFALSGLLGGALLGAIWALLRRA